MNATDICIPDSPGDPGVLLDIARTAQKLNFSSLVIVSGSPVHTPPGLSIIRGTLISGESIAKTESKIEKTRKTNDLVLVQAGDNAFNRSIAGFGGVDVLYGISATEKNSFDEVISRILSKKGIIVDLCLYPLIHAEEHSRGKVLIKYREIVKFQRRFGFPLSISTGARVSLDMRSLRECSALASFFGIKEEEMAGFFSSIQRRIERPEPVRLIE